MTRVVTALAISADGYIAGPNDGPGNPLGEGGSHLFEWYTDGDTPSKFVPNFRLSAQSAKVFDDGAAQVGAIISGRRTYEIANAWGGRGPLPGVPLFILTHLPPPDPPDSEPPYTFVTTGIQEAVELATRAAGDATRAAGNARRGAGDGHGEAVALMGSGPVRAALSAGLLDQITLHVVPVLLGGGVRLLDGSPASLRLVSVVDAPGVTHLTYDVLR